MNLLQYLLEASDQMLQTSAPTLESIGLRMFLSLLTIMVVWRGVEEALSSAQGGPGFNMARAIEFVLTASIGLAMIQFYEAPIPGVGYGFKDLVIKQTTYLSTVIGNDGLQKITDTIHDLQANLGSGFVGSVLNVYYSLVQFTVQMVLSIFSAVSIAIVGYGMVAAAVCALVGPIFIPFFIVPKLDFLFWGWFRAFLGFSFYKVVAAAVLNLLGHLYLLYYQTLLPLNVSNLVTKLPLLIVLVFLNIYILFKVPAITSAILSGHSHGSGFNPLSIAGLISFFG
jgi:hypothetical protein